MPSTVIVEGILIIAGIVAASVLAGTVITKAGLFSSTFTSTTEDQRDTLLTKIKVIYATNSSSTKVNSWVKNIGLEPVINPSSIDVFFGKLGSVQRIPYNTGSTPTWNFTTPVSNWERHETIQIDVYDDSALEGGKSYSLQVTTPNGVSDDYIFVP